jgi:hypothetical protein
MATAADRTATFALNIPLEGLPAHRDRVILHSIIENADGFIRYLRFLLADFSETPLPPKTSNGGNGVGWRVGRADGSLLEDLIRSLSRDPGRARAIDALIERLNDPDSDNQVVPPDFLAVWSVFRTLLRERARA